LEKIQTGDAWLSTIGASGVDCDQRTITINFDDVCVYKKGEILFNKDIEVFAAEVMKKARFTISL
jgi:glutamate N-acetyltransferase / amino-acid N-acetyltransferase